MKENGEKKILVALSGGVDSAVTALKLKEDGYNCTGATLKLLENDTKTVSGGRQAAMDLSIPFVEVDGSKEFKEKVIDDFREKYENGMTPSPCIQCNRYIKFSLLLKKAHEMGIPFMATGHYARVDYSVEYGRYLLKRAEDPLKDQSYMLYLLTQDQLAHVLFPLGNMTKKEVRSIAEKNNLSSAGKKDSQDICFVPNGDYVSFLENLKGEKYASGDFIDMDGNVLGKHKGIVNYTKGQRKGLGLSFPEPRYVVDINPLLNKVVLGKHEDLFSKEVIANRINLIAYEKIEKPIRVTVKTRYSRRESPGTLIQEGPDRIKVIFDEPERAVTPGQALVIYDGDIVIGGGTIVGNRE